VSLNKKPYVNKKLFLFILYFDEYIVYFLYYIASFWISSSHIMYLKSA